MQLATLMSLRPVAGAGLLITLTRRCPLSCAHCSTSSSRTAEQLDGDRLRRFVGSITAATAPSVVLLTGGEPLLRPDLVTDLAERLHAVGSAPAVLTGGFFARAARLPSRIRRALRACDHVSFSLDAFHEREVSRLDIFRCLRQLLDDGSAVSLHLLGRDADDPYLADVVKDVRRTFADRVPMLVSEVRAVGRAAAWLNAGTEILDGRPRPCSLAAWPVVAFDGSVLACCNQKVVDARPVPDHLLLGQLDRDDWPTVRATLLGSPTLRTIRTTGPLHLRERLAGCTDPAGGYCHTCRQLSIEPAALAAATAGAAGPTGALLDSQIGQLQQRAGAAALLRRYGSARYAELVELAGSA